MFYRLNTVPISLPALRQRQEDIHLIFRKFANDFAEKYRMPVVKLTADAVELINNYSWPGNVRQLKNMVEQLSVIETERDINAMILRNYIPQEYTGAPALVQQESKESMNEREIMYKFLFDMKKDLTELKKLVLDIASTNGKLDLSADQSSLLNRYYDEVHSDEVQTPLLEAPKATDGFRFIEENEDDPYEVHEELEESLSLEEREKELIQKALEKHRGKRKHAASELGISERTLYRKIKEYNL